MQRYFGLACAFALLASTGARAQEEKKSEPGGQPEFKAPAPKAVPSPPMPAPQITILPYQPRMDTRDVWQYYAPNRFGRMVPRVVQTPYGGYYSRDLQPYPWLPANPTKVLPIIVD